MNEVVFEVVSIIHMVAFWALLVMVLLRSVPGLVIRTRSEEAALQQAHATAYSRFSRQLEAQRDKTDLLTSQRSLLKEEVAELEAKLTAAHQDYLKLQNASNRSIGQLQQSRDVLAARVDKLERKRLKVLACRT